MGKYLELFRGEVGDLTEKTKLENKPYVAYSTKLGKVTYTIVPVKEEEPEIDLTIPYVTFKAEEANSTIGLESLSYDQTLEYSTDTTAWSNMNTSTAITLANVGDEVYVRGMLRGNNNPDNNYTQFKMTGKIAASGNCNALWNYQDLNAKLKACCGNYMFRNCTSLTVAPALPATELADWCYSGMFWGCTSLTVAPALPATTLYQYCYAHMFRDCTGITSASELPNATLDYDCYSCMFRGCTNLTHIKCLVTDIPSSSCTFSWVDGVSSNGTFVKHPDMTSWSTGVSGIPEGWTVVDAEV